MDLFCVYYTKHAINNRSSDDLACEEGLPWYSLLNNFQAKYFLLVRLVSLTVWSIPYAKTSSIFIIRVCLVQ